MGDPKLAPFWVRESLSAYVREGRPPGDFLLSCLRNDLVEAIGRADLNSRAALADIVAYIYWEVPSGAWRTEANIERWITLGGLSGIEADLAESLEVNDDRP